MPAATPARHTGRVRSLMASIQGFFIFGGTVVEVVKALSRAEFSLNGVDEERHAAFYLVAVAESVDKIAGHGGAAVFKAE